MNTAPKKIVMIANDARSMLLFRAGLIKQLIELHFIVIVCAPYHATYFTELAKLGARVMAIKLDRNRLNPFREITSFRQIWQILRQNTDSFFIFYTIKPVIYGSLAASLLQLKHVFAVITGLGYVFVGNSLKQRCLRFLAKPAYRLALRLNQKIFFLNHDDSKYFIDHDMVAADKAVVINGEGVDLTYFNVAPLPAKMVFLFAGRLLKDKGIYEYIAAAAALKHKYPEISFELAGDIDDNPTSITKIELERWCENGSITYRGFVADTKLLIKTATVLVLPSYREGMPVAILEAMAMGRPIITTDVAGCRETVIHGVNGYLIATKNAAALILAMEKLILTPSLCLPMGMASRQIAQQKFDVNQINHDILQTMGIL